MKAFRLEFMLFLYKGSSRIYAELFKGNKVAWRISKQDFLDYPKDTLGFALGMFYLENGFDVMPKLENHDVFHLLTNTGTEITDEIAMQYLLLGNGKISLYLIAMIFIGTLLFPEQSSYYWSSFKNGKSMLKFYPIEFKYFLSESFIDLQKSFYKHQLIIQSNPIKHGK